MKLIHCSDLHLGKTLFERDILEDQAHILAQLEEALLLHKPAALLIAGDVFDRAVPSPESVTLFSSFLVRIKTADPDLKAAIIPGNHDSAARLSFGDGLLELSGVHMRTRPEDCASPILLERGEERAFVWALPYLGPGSFADAGTDVFLRSQEELFGEAMRRIGEVLDPEETNVLLCHAFAKGGIASESERVFLGNLELVKAESYAAFDYVALGHLHRPQVAGKNGRYSGSPLAYSFPEADREKRFILVDVGKCGFTETEIPVSPLRRMSRLEGKFSDLLSGEGFEAFRGDYLELVLDDPNPVLNPTESLKEKFPYILSVRQKAFELRITGEGGEARTERRGGTSVMDDFLAFHEKVLGRRPEEESLRLFTKLAKEAEGDETS